MRPLLTLRKCTIHVSVILICGSLFIACSMRDNWVHRFFKTDRVEDSFSIEPKEVSRFLSTVRPADDNIETQYRLARYFQDQGKHEIAEEILLDIVRMAPDHVKSYNALGISYDSRGKYDLSEMAYNNALRLGPNSHFTYNNLGYSFYLQDNFSTALIYFKKAVALNPTKRIYHNNLGLCYFRLNDFRSAQDEFILSGNQPYMAKMEKLLATSRTSESSEALAVHQERDRPIQPEVHAMAEITSVSDNDAREIAAAPQEADGFYAVQAGVYRVRSNAWDLFADLHDSGFTCIYMTKVKKENPYYRVRMGKFSTKHEAEELASRVSAMYHADAFVVHENRPLKNTVIMSSVTCDLSNSDSPAECGLASIEISNGNGVRNMAKRLSSYLSRSGFNITRLTNAPNFKFEHTRIFFKEDSFKTACHLAQKLADYDLKVHVIESAKLKEKVKVLIGRDLIPFQADFRRNDLHDGLSVAD